VTEAPQQQSPVNVTFQQTPNPLDQRDLEAINREFSNVKEMLTRIESKQDYTNGRVRELEKSRVFTKGVLAALGFFFGLPSTVGAIIGVLFALRELY
jgi:hypothetical protein